jgi:hypothetical protein
LALVLLFLTVEGIGGRVPEAVRISGVTKSASPATWISGAKYSQSVKGAYVSAGFYK